MSSADGARRLRIALVIPYMGIGGAERQLSLLARGLAAAGHEVLVVTLRDGGQLLGELGACDDPRLTVASLGLRSRLAVFRCARPLAARLQSFEPDVVYAFLVGANLVTGWARRHLPGPRLVWSLRASAIRSAKRGPDMWLLNALERRAARRGVPDLVIANSEAGRQDAIDRGYPGGRIVVVPNGIETTRFHPQPEAAEQLRKRWGFALDRAVIGTARRIHPDKDLPTFLRMAAALSSSLPQAPAFVIAGSGSADYRAQLERLAEELGLTGDLVWEPAVTELAGFYSALDVFVLPTASGEGFPNVLGEALACGTACVSTDSGDARQILEGVGRVVAPRDAEGLAAAVSAELREPLVSAAERQERASTHYSPELLVARTAERFWALCDEGEA